MTAKTAILLPKHRVSVRGGVTSKYTQDASITLAPGDTLLVTGGGVTPPPPPPPPVDPPPPPPPPPVDPAIPSWRPNPSWIKNFADDLLAPFRSSTIPSDKNHLSVADGGTVGSTDPMSFANRYGDNSTNPPTPLHVPDFSGPYVREVATRRADNLYAGTILSTADDPAKGAATKIVKKGSRISIRFAFRMLVGYVTWGVPLWLVGWTGWDWNGMEIDICENIKGMLTFNIHQNNKQVFGKSIAPPADLATVFHTAGVDITPTSVTFFFDEKPIGTWTGVVDHDLAYVSDDKVGVPWEGLHPTTATPDTTFVDLAWVTEHPLP